MKIKPEERPTVIGLGIATGVMLVIGVMRLAPQLTGGDKTAATQNTTVDASGAQTANPGIPTASTASGVAGTPAANRMPASKTDMYSDAIMEPTTTRDPFTPAMPDAGTLNASRSNLTFTRERPLPPGPATVTVLPRNPSFLFPGKATPATNSVTPGNDLQSEASQVVLAGVIAGPQAVAVVHIGDRSYPLVPGEKMPFNMSLGRITEEGAYVKQGKQMWFIQVGKSLSSAMPMKPGMKGFTAPDSMAPAAPSRFMRRVATTQNGQPVNNGQSINLVEEAPSTAKESGNVTSGQTRP